MTLLEAIETKRRFKRPGYSTFVHIGTKDALHYLNSNNSLSVGVSGLTAEDWYVEGIQSTISVQQLNDALVEAKIDPKICEQIIGALKL